MTEKKKRVKIQYFRPKDLNRIKETLAKKNGIPPTLENIQKMAENTIKDTPKYVKDKKKQEKMIEDARKTISEVEKKE